MRDLLLRTLPCGLLLMTCLAGLGGQRIQATRAVTLEARVDAYLKPYLEVRNFSGSVLIAKGGKVLLSKGYGMASYEYNVPDTPRTKFQIASMSKPFTAAAILLLEERGRLSLSDPLTKYIPDYPNGDKITIHHLLAHKSGIPNVNSFPDYNDKSRFPQTLAQIIGMFKDKPLTMQPGERFSYSNSNYNVLAYVIEKASGESYGDFLRKNIFDPLGMKDTAHRADDAAVITNLATGYSPVGADGLERAPYLDWTIKTGNGSLYSTVEDMYKFDRALYAEKILKRGSLDKMFAEPYAWFTGKRFGRRVFRYGGRSPGFQGEIQRFVDDNACVVVLGNNYSGAASMISYNLGAILFGEKFDAPELAKSLKVDPNVVAPYTGRYKAGADFALPNVSFTVEEKDGHLLLKLDSGAVSALIPLADGTFLERNFFAGKVTFAKDEKGQVSHLILRTDGEYRADKVKNQSDVH